MDEHAIDGFASPVFGIPGELAQVLASAHATQYCGLFLEHAGPVLDSSTPGLRGTLQAWSTGESELAAAWGPVQREGQAARSAA